MFFLGNPAERLGALVPSFGAESHSLHSQLSTVPVGRRGDFYRVPALDQSTGYTAVAQRIGLDLRIIVCDSTGERVSTAYVEPWRKKKADRVASRLLKKARRGSSPLGISNSNSPFSIDCAQPSIHVAWDC